MAVADKAGLSGGKRRQPRHVLLWKQERKKAGIRTQIHFSISFVTVDLPSSFSSFLLRSIRVRVSEDQEGTETARLLA